MTGPDKPTPPEERIREHSYDGIQEYDKKLPNWWLFTLYGAIVFAFFYWFYYQQSGVGKTDREILAAKMAKIEQSRREAAAKSASDADFWAMAQETDIVNAGRDVFEKNCVSCHMADLRGVHSTPPGIGADLVDSEWIHGGLPKEIKETITNGVAAKGMPAWGPILGDQRITDVVAFILSHHQQDPEGVAR